MPLGIFVGVLGAVWAGVIAFGWALCRIAATGDEQIERALREQAAGAGRRGGIPAEGED